jgi:hypothetical protein
MNKYTEIIAGFFFFAWYFSGEVFATKSFYASAPGLLHGECGWYPYFIVSYSIMCLIL